MEVTNVWHKTEEELPEEGREVLGAEVIDEDCDTGERYGLQEDMYYFKAGTILKVEKDRKNAIHLQYEGQKPKSPEQKLLEAIFGEGDGCDLQEIEEEGWYTFDTVQNGLFRYRRISDQYSPTWWCYPMMPDGIEMNRRADFYDGSYYEGRNE